MGAALTVCVGRRRVRLVLFEGSRLDNHCLIELTSVTSHLDPRDDLFLGGPLLRPPFLDGSLPAGTLNDPLDETILFRTQARSLSGDQCASCGRLSNPILTPPATAFLATSQRQPERLDNAAPIDPISALTRPEFRSTQTPRRVSLIAAQVGDRARPTRERRQGCIAGIAYTYRNSDEVSHRVTGVSPSPAHHVLRDQASISPGLFAFCI